MAGKLDQDANSRAGEAAKLLADVLEAAGEALIHPPRAGFMTTVANR